MNNERTYGMDQDGSSKDTRSSATTRSHGNGSSVSIEKIGSPGTGDYGTNSGTPFGSSSTEWSPTADFASSAGSNPPTGLKGMLDRIGLGHMDVTKVKDVLGTNMTSVKDKVNSVDMKASVDKARGYAAANPGKVLGGLAALAIGLGMMRGRKR